MTKLYGGGYYIIYKPTYFDKKGQGIEMKAKSKFLSAFIAASMVFAAVPFTAYGASKAASVDGQEYDTLQAAINAADGKTVVLETDVKESVTIPEGSTITLDLQDNTLTNKSGSHTVTNKGNLTITGSGTIDNVSHGKGALVNNGTVTMKSGTLTRSKEAGSSATNNGGNSWYVVDNNGDSAVFNMEGGKIYGTSRYSSLIRNLGAQFNMIGGDLESGFIVLKNDDNGKIKMTGGTATTTASGGSAIQNWGKLEMTGGTLKAADGAAALYALSWNKKYAQPEAIIGGDAVLNGNVKVQMDRNYIGEEDIPSTKVTFNGGTVTGDIEVMDNGDVAINDGVFKGKITKTAEAESAVISGGTFSVAPDASLIDESKAAAGYTKAGEDAVFFVGTSDEINEKLSGAADGDRIDVISGKVDLKIAEGVVVSNDGGEVTVNGEKVEKGDTLETPHVHNAVKFEAKDATDTEDGNIEYWYCAGCDKYFSDAALTKVISKEDTVIAAGKTSDEDKKDPVNDDPKNEESKNETNTPKMGDEANIFLYVLLLASAGVLGGTVAYKRKVSK